MIKIPKYKIGNVQLTLTLLVWILIFAIPFLFGDFENGINWDHIFKVWKEYSVLLIIFLTNRFLLMPNLFFKGKRRMYFISIIVLIILFAAIMYLLHPSVSGPQAMDMRPPPPGGPRQGPQGHFPGGRNPAQLIPPYVNLIIMSILLTGFDSGLMFFSKWMQSEQNKLKAEKESIQNKMAFLQNQISPHFFMNTLNNIHALVDIDSEKAKNSIIKLSKMMDYMLYETQSSKIPLNQEMEFIKSYVDLMKLRFTDDIELEIQIPDIIPAVKIPPLLTISFIENAFKYGISYNAPSFVKIYFNFEEDLFSFRVHNSIHRKNEKGANQGIGIDNARNRLDLIFKTDYQLEIQEESNQFDVNLIFPL